MGSIIPGVLLLSNIPRLSHVFTPEALFLTSATVAFLGVVVLYLSRPRTQEAVPQNMLAQTQAAPAEVSEQPPATPVLEREPHGTSAPPMETAHPQLAVCSDSVSAELPTHGKQPLSLPGGEHPNQTCDKGISQTSPGDNGNPKNSLELTPADASTRAPALGARALIADTARLLSAVVTPAPGVEVSPLRPSRGLAGFQPAARFSRSQQAFLRIPIVISGRTESGAEFREETCTVILLPQGVVIHMEQRVRAGDRLTLLNQSRQQEVPCSVFGTLPGPDGKTHVELEFSELQRNFWPVSFPAWAGNASGGAAGGHPARALASARAPALDNSGS